MDIQIILPTTQYFVAEHEWPCKPWCSVRYHTICNNKSEGKVLIVEFCTWVTHPSLDGSTLNLEKKWFSVLPISSKCK